MGWAGIEVVLKLGPEGGRPLGVGAANIASPPWGYSTLPPRLGSRRSNEAQAKVRAKVLRSGKKLSDGSANYVALPRNHASASPEACRDHFSASSKVFGERLWEQNKKSQHNPVNSGICGGEGGIRTHLIRR